LFLDFLYRLFSAESKTGYFFRHFGWADLLASVPVAQLKILRVFRLLRVYRLLKEYGAKNVLRSLVADRAGSALWTLLFVAILVLEFGSLEMLNLEAKAAGANITTASDAIWYVIVTISTVGYGDQYPVTNPGRLMGAIIIVIGVGIFGTLTGYLANAFLSPSSGSDDATSAPVQPVADVDRHLARLGELARIKDSGLLTDDEVELEKQRILSDA
jgi:voltage-gated potassium channel